MNQDQLKDLLEKVQADHQKISQDEARAVIIKYKLEGAAEILGVILNSYPKEDKKSE